ncbi:hypothetical protein [Palleronia sp.]|uniref:hypothetical protein n=1 Tax=Palleronia sp. TaxID=1940284 RepID=UPI0035C80CB7
MKSIWAAVALIVAGLVIVVLRPAYLADGQAVGVYSFSGSVLPWIGWILLVAGVILAVVGFTRSRKKNRRR